MKVPAPALQLANRYRPGDIDLRLYLVSEKFDGCRALWDGYHLISRGGRVLSPPRWFIEDLPKCQLDGELYAGPGKFNIAQSVIARARPHDGWQQMQFIAFDTTDLVKPFTQRLQDLRAAVNSSPSKYIYWAAQHRVESHGALIKMLNEVIADGGEGLMLHRADSVYTIGRSDNLLKVKPKRIQQALI